MSDVIVVAIIAALPGTIAAVLGIVNRQKLGVVGERVNGRLSELLELTRQSSKADGIKEEHENAKRYR